MAQNDHKLFTTPVSVNDGFKRSDGKTWATLGIVAIAALLVVVLINVFVDRPKVRWPSSSGPQAAPTTPAEADEPRTYDVAPQAPRRPQ